MTRLRPTTRALLAVTAIALAACGGGGDDTTTSTSPPDASQVPPADAVDVTITGVDLGSDQVTIRGEAPTPCNDLGSVVLPGDPIEIFVWAEPLGPEETCVQVIEPFEITLSFEPPSVDTSVNVNGEEIGMVFP